VRRHRQGWLATGPGFSVWQEDEASARGWFELLMDAAVTSPERTDEPAPDRAAISS
jgi:hypothetical protein